MPCRAAGSDFSTVWSALSERHSADAIVYVVPVRAAAFDEPNLVSHAGLVPAIGLASLGDQAGFPEPDTSSVTAVR